MRRISITKKIRIARWRRRRWMRLRKRRSYLMAHKWATFERGDVLDRRAVTPRAVPSNMCLQSNYEQVARWLKRIRLGFSLSILKSGRSPTKVKSYFDYARISRITPEVALVIASEYDRLTERTGLKLGAYNRSKWRPDVAALLSDIGFFDLLGMDLGSRVAPAASFVKMSRFESGDNIQSAAMSAFVKELFAKLVQLQLDVSKMTDHLDVHKTMHLISALLEATENTRQHAYSPEMRVEATCVPKWWLTGAVYPEQKRLVIVVYDQGISIPGKVSEVADMQRDQDGNLLTRLARAMSLYGRNREPSDYQLDHARLRFAMKYGHSSTKFPYRGKGLPIINDVVKHCSRGKLTILSRHAKYVAETGRRVLSESLSTPIAGTLIIWDLCFSDDIGVR